MSVILRSKKGISPLIATILLISFAVALGSVVVWGVNLNLGKLVNKCDHVAIKIREISSAEVCYSGFGANGYINFVIDNVGEVDINGISLLIIGDKGTRFLDLDNITIHKGLLYENNDKKPVYDFTKFGDIKKVQFIPKIRTEKTIDSCPKKYAQAEKIRVCS